MSLSPPTEANNDTQLQPFLSLVALSSGCYDNVPRMVATVVQGLLFAGIVMALWMFAHKVSELFTWLENHPTITKKNRHFVAKCFTFTWIYYYSYYLIIALVYVPFGQQAQDWVKDHLGFGYIRNWQPEKIHLDQALLIPLVATQLFDLIWDTFVPFLRRRIAEGRARRSLGRITREKSRRRLAESMAANAAEEEGNGDFPGVGEGGGGSGGDGSDMGDAQSDHALQGGGRRGDRRTSRGVPPPTGANGGSNGEYEKDVQQVGGVVSFERICLGQRRLRWDDERLGLTGRVALELVHHLMDEVEREEEAGGQRGEMAGRTKGLGHQRRRGGGSPLGDPLGDDSGIDSDSNGDIGLTIDDEDEEDDEDDDDEEEGEGGGAARAGYAGDHQHHPRGVGVSGGVNYADLAVISCWELPFEGGAGGAGGAGEDLRTSRDRRTHDDIVTESNLPEYTTFNDLVRLETRDKNMYSSCEEG